MKEDWWIVNRAKIASKPTRVKQYLENGCKYIRYNLSEKEQKVPFDPIIDIGIYFR